MNPHSLPHCLNMRRPAHSLAALRLLFDAFKLYPNFATASSLMEWLPALETLEPCTVEQ
jgi:hypothetical protein